MLYLMSYFVPSFMTSTAVCHAAFPYRGVGFVVQLGARDWYHSAVYFNAFLQAVGTMLHSMNVSAAPSIASIAPHTITVALNPVLFI